MPLTAPIPGPIGTPDPPITVREFASFANSDRPDEQRMTPYVNAAVLYVEERCGPIAGGQYRFVVSQNARRQLVLPLGRITEIESITDPHGNVVTLDHVSAARDVDWLAGIITVPYTLAGTYEVVATVAPSPKAESLKLAALIIARHLWETQRGLGARASAYGDAASIPAGVAIPRRAEILMESARDPVGFA